MGKRSPEQWEKVKKWVREQTTAAFWLVLSALLILLFWVAFDGGDHCGNNWICSRLGVIHKTEAIKMLGVAIAGVMASWGVVAANRRSDAMAKSANAATESAKAADSTAQAADSTAKAADSTAKATEAGNRQRAFKDGVEHLGSGKSSVRQGGAHALFHLALKDKGLHASIAGVLCAHIRETTGKKSYQEKNKDKPSTEMQSLLRLLFTTETVDKRRLEEFWQGITPDLNGGYFCGVELENAWFQGAKLRSTQFQKASLEEAQFEGASLKEAQFEGASLKKARFQKASLEKAQFQGASLEKAQFEGARLRESQFQEARLKEAQFQGASLEKAQFQGASLQGAQFQGASLEKAQFEGASLHGAQFQRASLEEAQFQRASLEEAQFQRTTLRKAQFQGASLGETQFQWASLGEAQFQGASLREAQFHGASLEGAQFQGASLYMAGFQQAQFGQGSGHDGIPAQDRVAAKSDDLAEQLKASAFHGVSSGRHFHKSFEERVNERAGKESDFSKVIFAGGVTQELLAKVKKALELASWSSDSPGFKKKLIQDLKLEIGQPESHAPPKEVIAGSTTKKTLSGGFGSSAKPWQQSREPTKPHSAADIAVTEGWPTHENRKAAVCGAGLDCPCRLPLEHVHLQEEHAISGSSFRSPGGRCQCSFGILKTPRASACPNSGPRPKRCRCRLSLPGN